MRRELALLAGAGVAALIAAPCGPGSSPSEPPDPPEPASRAARLERAVDRPRPPRALKPAEWVLGNNKAFLTFDDARGAGSIERALRALERADARAAFFLPGAWIDRHPAESRRIVDAGHDLGNRGWSRKPLSRMEARAAKRSIARAERVIVRFGGSPRPFLRFPRGERDLRSVTLAGRVGYRSVRWSYRPGGGRPAEIARATVRELRPGAIVSLDLRRPGHARALPRILSAARRKEIHFAPLAALSRAHPVRWDLTVQPGSKGKHVEFVQRELARRTYPAGAPDGRFGANTLHAAYAFEKANGLELDGRLTPEEIESLILSDPPDAPRVGGGSYVDVDVGRQVLFEVRDGRVVNTLPVSTASGELYESEGELRVASTPTGTFSFERKIPGWRVSELGELYYPSYFYGGYAIHGSPSVPPYPASHGCIRIPMHVAADFFARNPVGTPVYVHD